MNTCAAMIMLVVAPLIAAAQPQDTAPLETQAVMRSIERAYRSEPLAERITISVRTSAAFAEGPPRPPRTSQSTVTFRADPPRPDVTASMRLEMPTFALWFGNGRVVGAAQPPIKAVFVRDIGSAPIPRAAEWTLPRLPLPQIALAFGAESAWETLTPFCPGAAWEASARRAADGSLELVGRWRAGQLRLTVDPQTYRIRTFEVIENVRGDTAQIALKCTQIEPGDPRSWEIAPAAERLVASLSQLVASAPNAAPQDPVAALLLQDESLAPFALADDFLDFPPDDRPPAALVLIAFGADAKSSISPAVLAAIRALHELQRARIITAVASTTDTLRRTPLPLWRPLAVFDVKEFTRTGLQQTVAQFRSAAQPPPDVPSGAKDARPLVWTLGGDDLLNTLTGGEPCAVIVVGAELRTTRTIPVRDNADPRGLAREIDEAVKRLE